MRYPADIHDTALDVRTHYLYRIFNATGTLLYVGITYDLGNRLDQHRREKPWWHQKHSHTVEEAPSRADVLYREARAILTEHPRHNKDIPTLARFDVLLSRINADGEGLADADRIGILEHQLRQMQRRARAAEALLGRVQPPDPRILEAEVAAAALRSETVDWQQKATAAEERRQESHAQLLELSKSLHKIIDFWKERAKQVEEPRLFVVEGPRTASGQRPPACQRVHAGGEQRPVTTVLVCHRTHSDVPDALEERAPGPRGFFRRLFGS